MKALTWSSAAQSVVMPKAPTSDSLGVGCNLLRNETSIKGSNGKIKAPWRLSEQLSGPGQCRFICAISVYVMGTLPHAIILVCISEIHSSLRGSIVTDLDVHQLNFFRIMLLGSWAARNVDC